MVIKGKIKTPPKIKGHIKASKIYPILENLKITSSTEKQVFNHPNSYGYDEVIVEGIKTDTLEVTPSTENQSFNGLYNEIIVNAIESEELVVTPSEEEQVKEGLFNKVTVGGIESEELNITPSEEEQIYEGLYKKVTVEGVEISDGYEDYDYDTCLAIADNILGDSKPYLKLGSIGFTGTQYIDTLTPLWSNSNWTIEMELTFSEFFDYSHLLSVSDSDANHESWVTVNGNFYLRLAKSNKQLIQLMETGKKYKIKHVWTDGTCETYIDDTLVNTTKFGSFTTENNLRFGHRTEDGWFKGDLHSLKFHAGEELVRNFVPCKDLGTTPCLYEEVEGVFFYNAGSGSFVAGEVV